MKVFSRQLARSTGRDLDLKVLREDKISYREAMKVAAFGNSGPLRELLSRALSNANVKEIKEKPSRYQLVERDTKTIVKDASGTLEAETQKQFNKLKSPLDTAKKKLESKVGDLKTQLQQYNDTKEPMIGKSNHRNVGMMIENRLAAAKHDLYEIGKQYKAQVPILRKQAAKIAEKKHPEAVAVVSKHKETIKAQLQQGRAKETPTRSR